MDAQPRERATIVWFRRDLRIAGNPALSAAADAGGPVVPVYLSEWDSSDPWAPGEAARWWLSASLGRLQQGLRDWGAPLLVFEGDPSAVLPDLSRGIGAREVLCGRLYEPFVRELDEKVGASLAQAGVGFRSLPGALMFEPEAHLSRAGRPYVQFGAFWRSCLSGPAPDRPLDPAPSRGREPRRAHITALAGGVAGRGGKVVAVPSHGSAWGPRMGGSTDVWEPGEQGAVRRLERFLERALRDYAEARDTPAVEGVSRLSPHLHFGEIGPSQVWYAVKEALRASRGGVLSTGAEAFLRQLGWREFAHHMLYHFPHTPERPFREEYAGFPWEDDPEALSAWQVGRTGYPLVDAGMRQLAAEGWMHNRVRMVVASFLTKDLLVPWQEGARWFWDHLVDADLANNTLGWQWTAGSGPDAAPYFRVYNPTLQAKRFDREHVYTSRWGPDDEAPSAPAPIVDHAEARLRALAAHDVIRGT